MLSELCCPTKSQFIHNTNHSLVVNFTTKVTKGASIGVKVREKDWAMCPMSIYRCICIEYVCILKLFNLTIMTYQLFLETLSKNLYTLFSLVCRGHLGFTPGLARRTIWDARDYILVWQVQGKFPSHCTLAPTPLSSQERGADRAGLHA